MLRILFVYIVISAIVELVTFSIIDNNIKGYYIAQNAFVFIESLLLLVIYFLGFPYRNTRITIAYIAVLYTILTGVILFCFSEISKPNNITSTIESVFLICLSIYFFYKIQTDLSIPSLKNYPFFWINFGVLIYFATTLILFLFDDYITHCGKREFELLWSLNFVGNIIYNSLFATALWKARSK